MNSTAQTFIDLKACALHSLAYIPEDVFSRFDVSAVCNNPSIHIFAVLQETILLLYGI
jgi:hypothetical protein